jgi:hypothetical protein
VDKPDLTKDPAPKISESQSETTDAVSSVRKTFVTPKISVEGDVLEATTFFQVTDSGSTT